jgi:pantoate--beta-alanine ligase
MSSRNLYLSGATRQAATALYRALNAGRAAFEAAQRAAANATDAPSVATNDAVRAAMRTVIAAEPLATLDYAEVCDPNTCAPLDTPQAPALLAIAARVGSTRLIDNFLLRADGVWEMGHSNASE